jgi:hypothetical protein
VDCFAHKTFHVQWVSGPYLEVVWRFDSMNIPYRVLRVKLILACPRDAKMRLVLNKSKKVALHSNSNSYLQACITSGKKLLILYAETIITIGSQLLRELNNDFNVCITMAEISDCLLMTLFSFTLSAIMNTDIEHRIVFCREWCSTIPRSEFLLKQHSITLILMT